MKKKVISKVKKKIEEFFVAEEGKVSKSTILKASVLVVAASTMMPNDVSAGTTYTSKIFKSSSMCVAHTNHASHASHSSY